MKTLIVSTLAAISCLAFVSCAGFNVNGETPYGKFVTNPDGSVTIVTTVPAQNGTVEATK